MFDFVTERHTPSATTIKGINMFIDVVNFINKVEEEKNADNYEKNSMEITNQINVLMHIMLETLDTSKYNGGEKTNEACKLWSYAKTFAWDNQFKEVLKKTQVQHIQKGRDEYLKENNYFKDKISDENFYNTCITTPCIIPEELIPLFMVLYINNYKSYMDNKFWHEKVGLLNNNYITLLWERYDKILSLNKDDYSKFLSN